jgi:hypothetical protein
MYYLVWYDPDPRHSTVEKITDACAAYQRRFSTVPNLVLVNATDVADLAGMEVRSEHTVQPHHFWVGNDEPRDVPQGVQEGTEIYG